MKSEHLENAALTWALGLWQRYMSNNFHEVRVLWYPAHSMVLEGRRSHNEETYDDIDSDIERRVALEVNVAVNNLTAAQRAAVEKSVGLSRVVRMRNYEEQLEEAQCRIWRHLLSRGCL